MSSVSASVSAKLSSSQLVAISAALNAFTLSASFVHSVLYGVGSGFGVSVGTGSGVSVGTGSGVSVGTGSGVSVGTGSGVSVGTGSGGSLFTYSRDRMAV